MWLALYKKFNIILFRNFHFWKIVFVDVKAHLTQTGSVLEVRRYQSTFHWSMRYPSSTLPVNCYHQVLRTYGFTIVYQSVLHWHDKLQCWVSKSGIFLKQMLLRSPAGVVAVSLLLLNVWTIDRGLWFKQQWWVFNKRSDLQQQMHEWL